MTMRGMRRLEARRQMEETNYLASKTYRAGSVSNPPVDYRALDYVSAYDNNLMCPICRCPFVDPVVLTDCDHCFCRDCIRQTWTSAYTPMGPRGDCPTCRTPGKLGPRSATSKILVNLVEDLIVKCPRTEYGCRAEVKRGEVQDHVGIYCGLTSVACPGSECDLLVQRKDLEKGCLHYDVSCLSCQACMQMVDLETHWRTACPDRKLACPSCYEEVYYRELDLHTEEACSATTMSCAGRSLGCTSQAPRLEAEAHALQCVLAKLAPVLDAQRERADVQEAAQKAMSRKIAVLDEGFAAMRDILYAKEHNPDRASADESRIPLLGDGDSRGQSRDGTETIVDGFDFDFDDPTSPRSSRLPHVDDTIAVHSRSTNQFALDPSTTSASYAFQFPGRYDPSLEFSLPSPFPNNTSNDQADNNPYASPLHHLLSMHESLRAELSRTSAALAELDGRHSMQILNENLRMREDVAYLGAQVQGVGRQVQWLTSAQLQRFQPRGGREREREEEGGSSAGAGAGVEAAVRAVGEAVQGVRRPLGQGVRRGTSEEGRTKL